MRLFLEPQNKPTEDCNGWPDKLATATVSPECAFLLQNVQSIQSRAWESIAAPEHVCFSCVLSHVRHLLERT